jgi:hypothetical protein
LFHFELAFGGGVAGEFNALFIDFPFLQKLHLVPTYL